MSRETASRFGGKDPCTRRSLPLTIPLLSGLNSQPGSVAVRVLGEFLAATAGDDEGRVRAGNNAFPAGPEGGMRNAAASGAR